MAASTTAAGCAGFIARQQAVIAYIHDGDTVWLKDKRKVRLIGIDTPELARQTKKRFQAEQPFGAEARDYARELIAKLGANVKLMPGNEATDKYGRHLFHIQLSDGSLLQTRLLQAGLATAFTTPPNQTLGRCYQRQETAARQQQKGIWSHPKYQIQLASTLTTKDNGFHIIKGKIRHIGESKKAFWLNFKSPLSARISKKDLKYFNTPLDQLKGKTVIIKGWLRHYQGKAQLSLRHPSALEIL